MKKTLTQRCTRASSNSPGMNAIPAGNLPGDGGETSFDGLTDEALFAFYQDGNEGAFSQLVLRYEPLISGFLHKRLRDEERVRDLTQDTFLRVHRARGRYDSSRKFSTWIYTIASNLLKNEYRNRARRRETTFSDLGKDSSRTGGAPGTVILESDQPNPEQAAYAGELRNAIEHAIGQLEDHHRIPFVMREVEDRSYEEISDAIGVPVGTVKSRLFRARSAFQMAFPVPV